MIQRLFTTTRLAVRAEDCEEFRRLYLEHERLSLTPDEAREMISRLCFLFERFAAWIAKEKAAGRVFQPDEPPHAPEGK